MKNHKLALTFLFVSIIFCSVSFAQANEASDVLQKVGEAYMQKQMIESIKSSMPTYPAEAAYGQPIQTIKIYQLIKIKNKADFDYDWLKKIDEITPPYPAGSNFQIGDLKTKDGKYTLYKFICTYYGYSHASSQPQLFHDLLILKTDTNKKVLDGYQYTLEWTDSPSLDLFMVKNENIILKRGLMIQNLELTNANGEELVESGILDNVFDGKRRF